MSMAAQIGLRSAYRPSIVSLNGRVLAIGRSVFAHGPSAATIRIRARLGSYKSLGNSAARQPPAATMPISMGNNRDSDGTISKEPSEQIRSNLRPALKGRSLTSRPRSAEYERSKVSTSAYGKRRASNALIDPRPLYTSAIRRGARLGIRRMRSSAALIRCSGAGRLDSFRAKARSFIGFRQIGLGRKLKRHLAKPPVITGGSHSTKANSDGGRQVAGLIDVMSILSPALV
jgi:hypothetical protein